MYHYILGKWPCISQIKVIGNIRKYTRKTYTSISLVSETITTYLKGQRLGIWGVFFTVESSLLGVSSSDCNCGCSKGIGFPLSRNLTSSESSLPLRGTLSSGKTRLHSIRRWMMSRRSFPVTGSTGSVKETYAHNLIKYAFISWV